MVHNLGGTALPRCPGPKLMKFDTHGKDLVFCRLISDKGDNVHSHVFEIRIGDERYALKIFKFYDKVVDEMGFSDSEYRHKDLEYYVDPFFKECRAFGRLNESEETKSLAVECYGYLLVPASRERELKERFGVDDWNRPSNDFLSKSPDQPPLRAIVKRLITGKTNWNISAARRILHNLRQLNALGIYNQDVHSENLVGGILVDFSSAWTEPHLFFKTRGKREIKSRRLSDMDAFDAMMLNQQVRYAPRASVRSSSRRSPVKELAMLGQDGKSVVRIQ